MPSDADLLRQIKERDSPQANAAFEVLFARYGEMIRRFVARTVRDEDGAEDVVQEAFLRVWTRAEQWDGRGEVKAWLYRIATNLALNYLRSNRRRRCEPIPTTTGAPRDEDEPECAAPGWLIDTVSLGPDAVAEQSERHAIFRQLVETLSEEKREVLRLVHDEDMDLSEAAQALGVPEGTVKSRLHYATRQLAQRWREMEDR